MVGSKGQKVGGIVVGIVLIIIGLLQTLNAFNWASAPGLDSGLKPEFGMISGIGAMIGGIILIIVALFKE